MPLSIKVNLRVTGHCNQGGRKYMEDMFSVAYQQTSDDKDLEYAFFGIFDGHGGGEAAKFAKDHLMDIIVKQKNFWSDKDEDVLRAIRDGYVNTHYAMWRELDKWPRTASGLPSTAGTTASIAFIRKGKIYIGHVGDSGIILGYQDEDDPQWKAKPLTKDHKPESGPEMTRIHESGGKVISKSGVPRVVWNRPRIGHKGPVRRSTHIDEIPFLAVARSLGDLWSYNSELDTFVVSPEPDVKVIKVDVKSYRCLIFGTDGLWNMLTPQAAVAIVQAAERHNEKHFIASQQTGNLFQGESQMWINPSKSLVDRALERWSSTRLRADNTSVVTLMIDPPGPSRCEVLMNRRQKEPVPSVPEMIPTPVSPHPCNPNFNDIDINKTHPPMGNVVEPPNPIATSLNVQSNSTNEKFNPTLSPSSSSFGLNESLPSDYSFQENSDNNRESFVDNSRYDKVNDNDNNDTILSEPSVKESTIMENIQVAEISSSDISSDDSQISSGENTVDENESVEENTDVASKNIPSINDRVNESIVNDSSIETTVTEEKISDKHELENIDSQDYQLTRGDAFFGSWDSFNGNGSKLSHSANSNLADLISNPTPLAEINSTEADCKKDQLDNPIPSSSLEKQPPDLSTSVNNDDKVENEINSAQQSPQLMPATSTSSSDDQKMLPPASLDSSRLKRRREIPLRPGSTRRTKEMSYNKRRHSSTLDETDDAICSVPEAPNSKRRTRSEDRRCNVNGPTDENNPINQEQSQQQPLLNDRVHRWPGNSRRSEVSKIRNVNSPTTSYSPPTNTNSTSNTREKITVSPTSFQRRSLEKKATPVKTIRRPSINGSSRVQMRGSFALRDWDQTKSNLGRRRGVRAGSCSSDRSKLNRVITDRSSMTADPTTSSTTPQRWLRSDTIAAIPIKTLRSRNVDIASGHTVPPQLAHQYNYIKQNRLSMPPPGNTKLRMSTTPAKVKTTAITTMSPGLTTAGKLKQTGGNIAGANGSSSASVSANVPGIAKRVKSSPYNPSARSLGTRSRLKRLSK